MNKPSAKKIRKRIIRKYYRKPVKLPLKLILLIILIGILYILIPNVLAQGEDNTFNRSPLPVSGDREIKEELEPDEQFYKLLEENEAFKKYIESINVKNNNPGNLLFANQPNATDCDKRGFACFPNIKIGFRSLIMQVYAYQNRGYTLEEFITKYSPPHENDTATLIKTACEKLEVSQNTLLITLDTIKIAQVIAHQEFSIKIINY